MVAMKLCILSSEIVPYAKTGGLADVAGALLQELKLRGHDVRAFMPLYTPVRRAHPGLRPVPGLQNIEITLGAASVAGFVFLATRKLIGSGSEAPQVPGGTGSSVRVP